MKVVALLVSFFAVNLICSAEAASAEEALSKPEPGAAEHGEASYYSKGFEGKKTASGEAFDPNKHTAAHPALPLGTEVEVRNKKTGKKVQVKVNDRGPNVLGRNIDVSRKAAEEIGMKKEGTAPVEVKVVAPPESSSSSGPPQNENEKGTFLK